jgi:hypothetical protein
MVSDFTSKVVVVGLWCISFVYVLFYSQFSALGYMSYLILLYSFFLNVYLILM